MTSNWIDEGLKSIGSETQLAARRGSVQVAIRSRKGRELGMVQKFAGNVSAKDLRAKYKDLGFKGAELTAKVNETLLGQVDMREVVGVAWLQRAFQLGFACDEGILRKKTGALKLVKVTPAVVAEPAPITTEAAVEVLKKLSREELQALLGL